ncbi:hypothetical protein BGZ51_001832 [Haplosporangium sp. Z 767]|nr:hypothetical protein BGZ51_001832 [Haplosporangium sp. Z 767]KAF9192706.1 hypothetical protein BGZ50_008263 [Haplosporangium sp. Z 11]
MFKATAIRPSIPTRTFNEYWLWAQSPSKDFLGGPRTGKWMLFYDKPVLDEKWAAVKQLVEQDMLGGLAKCSTAKENPNATSSKSGVVIVYTSDYLDQEEVYRIAAILHEKLEYNRTMYYKTDEQTSAGAYRKHGSKKNHIYRYPPS